MFNGVMKFFFCLFPRLLSKSAQRIRENHTRLLLPFLGFFYAAQQFMNGDRMGLSFQLEPSRLSCHESVELIHDLCGCEDLSSQVSIETVHSCCRIYSISRGAVPITIPGADITEENLPGMNADADGKFQSLERAIELAHCSGDTQGGAAGLFP